ncbi:VWA domain-containing protein [Mycolicibacterium hippocampi]|uniref:VWA domain-containing protein n=1 Tax=Mycolicibacterium hippocampi TaxID=659824 RepID=UPI0035175D08
MTFDPVLPLPALGAIAVALLALRLVSLALAAGSRAGRIAILRWCGTTLAVLLLLVAAARPGTGTVSEEVAPVAQGANVYFVVDRSADSAIADHGDGTRMAGIRQDMAALIDAHPGSRFAVIAFASRPAIDWPLSSDTWSLQPVVDALNPYADATSAGDQVNAGAAANVLRYQLIAAGQQYPQAENLVYYFGSGAAQSSAPQGEFDTGDVDGGAVFGYGGGPGLDETALRGIAEQLGVPYIQREPGQPVPQGGTSTTPVGAGPQASPERTELYWVFTMRASLLLLIEIYLTARELRRARSTHRQVLS